MAVLAHEGSYSIMYGRFGIPVGIGYRSGYLARPDKAGRYPVVLIAPALSGLSSHERDLCRDLARQGLAALAIDLYRKPADDPEEAYRALSDRRALTDFDEAHEFLTSEDVDWAQPGIGLLGLDVGGRFALALAANRPWVRSVAVVYTPLTGDDDREIQVAGLLSHLGVPVMGLYGAEDELIQVDTVDEAQRRNESGQWLLYEGAGHDFLDVTSDGYHPDAAADAQARLVEFFQQTLPAADEVDLG